MIRGATTLKKQVYLQSKAECAILDIRLKNIKILFLVFKYQDILCLSGDIIILCVCTFPVATTVNMTEQASGQPCGRDKRIYLLF